MEPKRPRAEEDPNLTSLHIRRAGDGEEASLAWVVARFTPFLKAQAEYRLRGPLRRFCDPADLVDDVWATVIPRFPDIRSRDGHWTPVLLRFLGTTLLHKVNHLLSHYARSTKLAGRRSGRHPSGRSRVERVPDRVTSAMTRAMRAEAYQLLHDAIEKLEAHEREILVLRGIEQLPHAEIASLLGAPVSTVAMRYHRTLEKLRASLAGSILEELPGE
jgi:RNA polymerase sigma factor (sigma-70 family)